jgi:alcohol dehydrogenase class IV
MNFEFATATRIIFGPGRLREVGPLARECGRRAFVVIGRNAERAEPLLALLREQNIGVVLFSVAGEPEIQTVEAATAMARSEQCDFVVSFGGGSVIDAGKAVAAMMANTGEVLDYVEVIGRGEILSKPSVPFIAIPTTAGTGSEVTRNAVLGSAQDRLKVSLRSPFMLPKIALVDPELTYNLPPELTAYTGLDALTQLIEPYVSSRANPVTDALCTKGLHRIARSLRRAFDDGRDHPAREDMALASLFGGLALANAGLGVVHGLAGPIGGMFSAPHGAICAALLPHAMEINLQALRTSRPTSEAVRRYATVAGLLTGNPDATVDEGVEWVRQLVAALKIPKLSAYGVRGDHSVELAENAANTSSMKGNPLLLNAAEIIRIVQLAL